MTPEQIAQFVDKIRPKVISWRRDFHRYPELGWTEFRTASIVARTLSQLGFTVKVGREAVKAEARLGLPHETQLSQAKERALHNGGDPYWIDKMGDGLTGVVGIWETGRPGPTIAFRFDMDALEIMEDRRNEHLPSREGFRSRYDHVMHACGHDGHTAIGLGLAFLIANNDSLGGRIKLIFQPAEEGGRGAKAMVEAGVVDDVDFFLAAHLGLTARKNKQVACGVTQFLASSKLDVELEGVPAHAAFQPHEGRNALLAAATMALQLQAIPRHGRGASRINVGMLNAGEGRNIIASRASLKLETRGETSEINQYMTDEAIRIIRSAAAMYGVREEIQLVGQTLAIPCDPQLVQLVKEAVCGMGKGLEVIDYLPFLASEDATFMMKAVQDRGGMSTYMLLGTELKAGHHHHSFDFDEDVLGRAIEVFAHVLEKILHESGGDRD